MSKILLVEPYKMMQQAIAVALFPAHEIEIAETLPEADTVAAIKNYDVVLMDAAALREKDCLSAQTARALQTSRVPIIWLESEAGSGIETRDRVVVLHRPITRDALTAALVDCLGLSSTTSRKEKVDGTEKERKQAERGPAKDKKRKTAAAADQPQPEIIDLVDVVEEPMQQTEQPRKES
jgi:DNA-binding response OmpR family regulator